MNDHRVLIDTGAIYALVTRNDRHHHDAYDFARAWLDQGGLFVLPDVVFCETMTLLKARLGATVAIRMGQGLRQDPAYRWRPLDGDNERDTWATFKRFSDKDWSYTDCAIHAIARRDRIAGVFAFDRHFDQMPDVERLPRGT